MDIKLLTILLNDNEGSSLDFKETQLSVVKASDDEKSKVLKDFLSFANSWRQTDAYILLGVRRENGKSIVIGVTDSMDDATLQQLVNSKTNRPIKFTYGEIAHEGKLIGYVRIPKQKRPFYAKVNFGIVKKDEVYYRQGSSNTLATVDQLAQMREDDVLDAQPDLSLQFVSPSKRELLGTLLVLNGQVHEPHAPLPDYGYSHGVVSITMGRQDFYREMADYLRKTRMIRAVTLAVKNSSGTVARNVQVEIIIPRESYLTVLDDRNFPDEPRRELLPVAVDLHAPLLRRNISVEEYQDRWIVTASFDRAQPNSPAWSDSVFFLGSSQDIRLNLQATIRADNIEPQPATLTIEIINEYKPALTLEDIDLPDSEAQDE